MELLALSHMASRGRSGLASRSGWLPGLSVHHFLLVEGSRRAEAACVVEGRRQGIAALLLLLKEMGAMTQTPHLRSYFPPWYTLYSVSQEKGSVGENEMAPSYLLPALWGLGCRMRLWVFWVPGNRSVQNTWTMTIIIAMAVSLEWTFQILSSYTGEENQYTPLGAECKQVEPRGSSLLGRFPPAQVGRQKCQP